MENLDLYITSMPSSRPADYCLGYFDGAVFIDFNDIDNKVYLARVSFDGYGCCDLVGKTIPLTEEDSAIFRENMLGNVFRRRIMIKLIKKAILLNKAFIWEKALRKYKLI